MPSLEHGIKQLKQINCTRTAKQLKQVESAMHGIMLTTNHENQQTQSTKSSLCQGSAQRQAELESFEAHLSPWTRVDVKTWYVVYVVLAEQTPRCYLNWARGLCMFMLGSRSRGNNHNRYTLATWGYMFSPWMRNKPTRFWSTVDQLPQKPLKAIPFSSCRVTRIGGIGCSTCWISGAGSLANLGVTWPGSS